MLSRVNNIHLKPTRQVGFVLKPHGFKGQLRISLDEDYLPDEFLLLEIHNKFVPFAIQSFAKESGIIKLKDLNSIDQVQDLVNLPILELLDKSETEPAPFFGYTLIDTISNLRFEVIGIAEYPGNILIEFRQGFKDALIPMHDDIIISIDHEKKTILAIFPEGLLDL